MDSNANWRHTASAGKSPELEEGSLKPLFDRLRPRTEELPSLAEARRIVEARLSSPRAGDGTGWRTRSRVVMEKGWKEMWKPGNWSLVRMAAAVCVLLAVLACTVPLDYDREAGLNLRLTVTGELQPVLELLREGPWALESLQVDEDDARTVVQARLRNAREEDLEALRALAVVEDVDASPWAEGRRGTLFSMVMDNVFHVRLDISGLDDEEINRALNEQLQADGYPGHVTITRRDGMPNVLVEVDGDSTATPGRLTIELSDRRDSIATEGIWVQEGRPLNLELGDLDGLGEEQIRQRILAQLRARGVHPDSTQVFIQQRGDSSSGGMQRELRIQVRDGNGR